MSANELTPFEDPEARTTHIADEPSAEIALSAGVSGLDSGDHLVGDDGDEAFGEDTADETDRFGTGKDPVTLVRGADGVYAREDELGAGTVDVQRGDSSSNQPSLWRPSDRAQPEGRGHLHIGPGRGIVAGVAAVTFALAAGTAYEAYSDISNAGSPPGSSQSGPLRTALQPEAKALAEQAIDETGVQADGKRGVFQATQVSPDEVRLTAGADDFEDGATFSGEAAFVSITLDGPDVEASDLKESDAGDVSEVFVQETAGIPGSDGGAVDVQALIDNPPDSQARDRNDLLYAVGGSHAGQAWSGVYGVDDDTNENGYVGYSSDPNLTLTGPGPNDGTPMFDTGYWGGGSPPQLTADNGNASPVETAADVAHQTGLAFEEAVKELRDS